MCASLAENFVSRYEGKYTLGRSSGVVRSIHKRCESDGTLIDKVKAYFTLKIELVIYKA